jgi:hypothetical protein
MVIAVIIFSFLLISGLTTGLAHANEIVIRFIVKSFKHPFFHVGISCSREIFEDAIIDVLQIGLFFAIIDIEFYKDIT